MPQDWQSGLNAEQARAASHNAGPLIVLAGPGTGKTRVIIARVARLIEEGAAPESILALAYNVKAAEELRSRLAESVGARTAENVQARTFHSFGNSLIKRFGDWIGVRSERAIMDSAQSKRLLRGLVFDHALFEHLAASGREAGVEVGRRFIAACKNSARTPADAERFAGEWEKRIERNAAGLTGDALEAERQRFIEFRDSSRLFTLYDAECLQQGLMTFDDCLALPLRIFAEKPTTAAILRDEIKHIVVDEFQDQNRAQIELLRRLAPPASNPDLCVVGDDDQSIYGFRGADTRAFAHFAEVWPSHQQIALVVNYRSGSGIIAASNSVIARCASRFAPEKKIEANPKREGGPGVVEGVILEDDAHAGAVIAAMIALDRRDHAHKPFSSYAVMARQHKDLDAIEAELARLGVPARVRRPRSPAEDEGVKDLLAWIGLLTDPSGVGHSASVQRLLVRPPFFVESPRVHEWRMAFERQRSFGRKDDGSSFAEWLRTIEPADAAVARFLAMLDELRLDAASERAERVVFEIIRISDVARAEDLDGRARAARISALVRVLRFARTRQRFLEPPGEIAAFARYYDDLDEKEQGFNPPGDERLDADADGESDGEDAVQIMTAHAAKGLEFETVFLAKCRPRGFPAQKRGESDDDVRDALPSEFSGRSPDDETDEQRRLFYVACTRAEQRLVLLAKKKGSGGKTIDYFNELTQPSPSRGVTVRRAAEVLDAAGLKAGDDVPVDIGGVGYRRETIVRDEMARVRRHAYSALHDAAAADVSTAALDDAKHRLTDAAEALHALEHLRANGSLPEATPTVYHERLREVAARIELESPAEAPSRAMSPPLSLSYSNIEEYERCPACFYLKYVQRMPEEQTDALGFGSMVHKVLERFYAEVREAESSGKPRPNEPRLATVCETTIRELWPASKPFDRPALDKALAQTSLAFRTLHDPSSNILEIERTARFKYPDPDTAGLLHDFTAKIDRIDQSPDGGLVVIDYKTGHGNKGLREPPANDLQLCAYAMALPTIFGDEGSDTASPTAKTPDGFAEYWILSEGIRGRIALKDLDLAGARARIDAAIRGMLAGNFERSGKCKQDCAALGLE